MKKNYDQLKRLQVIRYLGGKCKECGFSDVRALQVDHVNNDGFSGENHRIGPNSRYKRILSDKTKKYQLLCANCNWIKRYAIVMPN